MMSYRDTSPSVSPARDASISPVGERVRNG
jgi:hypothetical protein